MAKLPDRAEVVIVGGGVAGCSVAYHLTKIGWQDVVLLERKQLTSGTTWHAAGLIGQMRPNRNMTRMSRYGIELYSQLEAETGLATGFLLEALDRGYRGYFVTFAELVAELYASVADHSEAKVIRKNED